MTSTACEEFVVALAEGHTLLCHCGESREHHVPSARGKEAPWTRDGHAVRAYLDRDYVYGEVVCPGGADRLCRARCDVCRGEGGYEDEIGRCPDCLGCGRKLEPGSTFETRVRCERCNGVGRLFGWVDQCEHCHGSGFDPAAGDVCLVREMWAQFGWEANASRERVELNTPLLVIDWRVVGNGEDLVFYFRPTP